MNKCILSLFILFFIGVSSLYCDSAENSTPNRETVNTPRVFFIPMTSYTFVTVGDIQSHNAVGGLALYRFNPSEKDKLFSVSLIYTPQILSGISPSFPNLYHTVALSLIQKINRHTIHGTFAALTDKPLYGGLRTFMGMAGYSYDLINGNHFSMDLGATLIVMDVNLVLDNGMSWLLWPIPSLSLSWEYEWLTFSIIPGAQMTIAPHFPFSLMVETDLRKYDASLWYRYFKGGDPSTEMMGMGVGVKRDTSNVMISDGGMYGVNYDAVYGTLRLLQLFEISGGWAFNGTDGYKKVTWETLFESAGYSNNSLYGGSVGDGFFLSISLRMAF